MYQAPETDRLSRGMKVKHLVQLVSLTVLFTWLLYQLNSFHNVKIAHLRTRVDDFADDAAVFDEPNNLVANADDQLVEIGDEVLSVNLLPMRNIRASELRELQREENNDDVDVLEQIVDEGDDSGEGDGGEDAGNFIFQEDHVRSLEIESEIELKQEPAARAVVATEEQESLAHQEEIDLAKSDPER
ncbi:hypothetical protein R1flu_017817 [Riccia fluitans]|uniref:Uncharacterized protein n=1 Tax=Riccia fluitans TaxID=41844 RepID=A0ABD1ZHF7_9MARC